MLVPIDKLDKSLERYKSAEGISQKRSMPEIADSALAADEDSQTPASPILTVEENLEKRRQMLEATALEPVDFAFERAIGNNDSVYSNFIELIGAAKRKVARIVVKHGSNPTDYATGFMVSDRLLLTNWHVFNALEDVADSEAEFFYELDIYGRTMQPVVFKLAAHDFFYASKDLDYCFVAVNPVDIEGTTALASIGYHYLNPTLGKLGEECVELLNIIHHPNGDRKQLSIRENTFSKITDHTIHYETDTAPGSSGSPVFNDQFQIVALHHKSVPSKSEDGMNYLDKDGKIIEPVGNKIDVTRIHWIANEGVRISVILKDIFQKYPNNSFVENLKKRPPLDSPPDFNAANAGRIISIPEKTQEPTTNTMDNNSTNNVQISFPASLIETNGNITININNQKVSEKPVTERRPDDKTFAGKFEGLTETEKLSLENSMNYANCRGYLSNFMGIDIPFPKPKQPLRKYVAKLKNNNQTVLHYHHFSVLFHAVRKMPIVSVINVDGNPELRKDKTERDDEWIRDNRLDYDLQLNDKYYASSGFDRGHMSRREDANWGETAELAKFYADLTCVYTNACPQVPSLNRSNRKGLWGKLESVILEKGVRAETGKSSKLTVLNGPIFAPTDPVFKGIQVPMEFWKIILWFDQNGKLRATGFKLSQANLVENIDFEKLDFDTNPDYKVYQCSIESLEKLTGLELSYLANYDTYKNPNPNAEESFTVLSEESLTESLKFDATEDSDEFV
jgi:endonuclease G, mitochondrial